jgi:hypothetical protein
LLGRADAVEHRHLDVHDDDVGSVLLDELDRLFPVARLPDDVVARLGEHLGEVEPDQGFVLRDDDAQPPRAPGAARLG